MTRKIILIIFVFGLVSLLGGGFIFFKSQKPKKEVSPLPSYDLKPVFDESPQKPKISPYFDFYVTDYILLNTSTLIIFEPEQKLIKKYDLENKTIEELYKNKKLKKVYFSPYDELAVIEIESSENSSILELIDFETGEEATLPPDIRSFVFLKNKKLFYHLNDFKENNYFGLFEKEKNKKLKNVRFQDINLVSDGQKVYFFERPSHYLKSYLFEFDLKNYQIKKLFDDYFSLNALPSSDSFLFLSLFDDQEWHSFLVDKNGKIIKKFNWPSIIEKCSFKKLLVCATSYYISQADFIEKWKKFAQESIDDLVIYDPKTKNETYFQLTKLGEFDIQKPFVLTNYLYFINRLDWHLYRIDLTKYQNLLQTSTSSVLLE